MRFVVPFVWLRTATATIAADPLWEGYAFGFFTRVAATRTHLLRLSARTRRSTKNAGHTGKGTGITRRFLPAVDAEYDPVRTYLREIDSNGS